MTGFSPGSVPLTVGSEGEPGAPGKGLVVGAGPSVCRRGGRRAGLWQPRGAPGPEPAHLPADPGWVFSVSPSRRSGSSRSGLVMEGTGERNRGFHLNKGVSGRS